MIQTVSRMLSLSLSRSLSFSLSLPPLSLYWFCDFLVLVTPRAIIPALPLMSVAFWRPITASEIEAA